VLLYAVVLKLATIKKMCMDPELVENTLAIVAEK
jgi:hypothetical protein